MDSEAKWEAHTGLDYTVVMLPGEMTDNASIRVYGEGAPALAQKIAALPELYDALRELKSLALGVFSTVGREDAAIEKAQAALVKAGDATAIAEEEEWKRFGSAKATGAQT